MRLPAGLLTRRLCLLRLCQAKRSWLCFPSCAIAHTATTRNAPLQLAFVLIIRSNGGCNAAASPAHPRSKSLRSRSKELRSTVEKTADRKAKTTMTGLVTHTTGLRKRLSREGLLRNLKRAGRSSTPSLRARRCGQSRRPSRREWCLVSTGAGITRFPLRECWPVGRCPRPVRCEAPPPPGRPRPPRRRPS
jgi:hypothetical protein